MSLQARIIALLSVMLIVSIGLGALFNGLHAKQALREEMLAGMMGGDRTIRSAFEDLPRSDHPARDLRQLISTFSGNRHVTATLVNQAGRTPWQSRASVARAHVPDWFRDVIAPASPEMRFSVPGAAGGFKSVILRASPEADLQAAWAELSSVFAVLSLSTLVGVILLSLVVRAALSPLRELSARFDQIGRAHGGDAVPVRERGPVEILQLEKSFNEMAARLASVRQRNSALETQLLTLQDEERAELARDLHDEIGPHLFAASLDAEFIDQLVKQGRADEIPEQVAALQATVSHVQREIRGMVGRLRPAQVTELGLLRAIQGLVKLWQPRRPEIHFNTETELSEAGLADDLKNAAFRIVQEAVSNAVQHARPTRVDIELIREDHGIRVRVANDGAAATYRRGSPGFGSLGMRERVASLSGQLSIHEPAGDEDIWTVLAWLPVSSRDAALKAADQHA